MAPEVPGSFHEGGELGYALAHAYGAAFDNPGLLVTCIVGDGEAESGPLAASWHSNKFLDPVGDGAVLPILQLNGYKIANPTVLARIPEDELVRLLQGYGHRVLIVAGDDPAEVHPQMAAALDDALDDIAAIQERARSGGDRRRPRWPMIVLRTPKGWTGPREVDGVPVEGTWRAHQVPLGAVRTNADHRAQLEAWMRSYRPEELFDDAGRPRDEVVASAPVGERRMSANPHANGGLLLTDLSLPDFRHAGVDVPAPGSVDAEATRVLGRWLADVVRDNPGIFRVLGPDEVASNRLDAVLDASPRAWSAELLPGDDRLARGGRTMEVLSEHLCQGWLEGYLLTGRHGLFTSYEAFIHIVDSMFNQHAKWLRTSRRLPWRAADRVAELPPEQPRVAPGPQRLLPPGPRLHRPRGQQEGGGHPGLPPARRQHAPVGGRPLPAQPPLRERDRGRQAAGAVLVHHGGGGGPLHAGHRDPAVGLERRRRRARRRAGLRRRRPHARGAGRDRDPARRPCPT